jgi:hypothetical protein
MGEQAIKSADPSVEIKTEGNRWQKGVKQVKLSVEGADVQVTQLVLGDSFAGGSRRNSRCE